MAETDIGFYPVFVGAYADFRKSVQVASGALEPHAIRAPTGSTSMNASGSVFAHFVGVFASGASLAAQASASAKGYIFRWLRRWT